jgi:hypothetical protein
MENSIEKWEIEISDKAVGEKSGEKYQYFREIRSKLRWNS